MWESRFGPTLIEVKEGRAYVNGQAVHSADVTPLPRGMPPVMSAAGMAIGVAARAHSSYERRRPQSLRSDSRERVW